MKSLKDYSCRYFTKPCDAQQLIDVAKKYLPPGSTVLEPFAGKLALVKADRFNYFQWTTNDIWPTDGLDYCCDYRFLIKDPVHRYDAVITNPPYYSGIRDVVEIIKDLGKLTHSLFIIVPCTLLRVKNLQRLLDSDGWSLFENLPTSNSFYSETDQRNKNIRSRIIYLERNFVKNIVHLLCPQIYAIGVRDAAFCFSSVATHAGKAVDNDFPYSKFGIGISNDKLYDFAQENIDAISKVGYNYARNYSANWYIIKPAEMCHLIFSLYCARNRVDLVKRLPFIKIIKS